MFTYVCTCITTSRSRHRVFPPSQKAPVYSFPVSPHLLPPQKVTTIVLQLPWINCAALQLHVNGSMENIHSFLCYVLLKMTVRQPCCK